jgi:hypothetical protein
VPELVDFTDVVQAHVQELKALDLLEAPQPRDAVLRQVDSTESGQDVQTFNLGELIGAQEQFFDPEVRQVLNLLNLISIE